MTPLWPSTPDSGTRAAFDPRLELAGFLDPSAAAAVIAEAAGRAKVEIGGCTIGHVRYEPGTSCLISYEVEAATAGRPARFSTRLYAHLYAEDKFQRALESLDRRVWAGGALLAGATPLADRRAILYEFPNDARLPRLADLLAPGAASAVMQRALPLLRADVGALADEPALRILRYKPESRAVLRCAAAHHPGTGNPPRPLSVVLRLTRSRRAEAAHRTLERLHRWLPAHVPLTVPRPLWWDPEAGLSAVEWIEGDRLADRWAGPDGEEAVRKTGRALAWLHASNAPEAEEQSRAAGESRIEHALALVAAASAAVASQAQSVRAEFRRAAGRAAAGQRGCVHGDFHQGQVLLPEGSVCFLDFDGAADGEIEQDLGNFKAQLGWLGMRGRATAPDTIIRSLFEGYREAARYVHDERRVRYWCAAGFVELAAKQYRRLRTDWQATVPRLLAAAETELLER